MRLKNEARGDWVPSGVAMTIESTSYALLTAVEHKDFETASKAACFLSSQENYEGGFKSTQVRSSFHCKEFTFLKKEIKLLEYCSNTLTGHYRGFGGSL